MSQWPLCMSGGDVRALICGRKTQTRRIVSAQNSLVNGWPTKKRSNGLSGWPDLDLSKAWVDNGPSPAGNAGPYLKVPGGDESVHRVYSRVQPGDMLWVKETFASNVPGCAFQRGYSYRADHSDPLGDGPANPMKWKPSIFMPRWASRITLEVTSVRVERVQEISKADAIAEGAQEMLSSGAPWPDSAPRWSLLDPHPVELDPVDGYIHCLGSPQMAFANLWNSINGEREGASWESNPLVWVLSFKRVQP